MKPRKPWRFAVLGLTIALASTCTTGCAAPSDFSTPTMTRSRAPTSTRSSTPTQEPTLTRPPTPTEEPTPTREPTPSREEEKEQAYLNSEDPGIQELVEQGLKPEFYESGGAVVQGEYDQWLAVWHEGEWLRLKNLRSGGVPVETGVKKIEEKELKGSPWEEAALAAYFLEEYWNDMNAEMGIDDDEVTPYEGWFWKIGVANQATGELETLRILVTARDQEGRTPFNTMGVLIFQRAQEGQVAYDMDAVLKSEDQGIGPEDYKEVRNYLEKGYALGLNGLHTRYRMEEQLLDNVPAGRMPIIRIADAVCGQEISDQDTRTLTEQNAELLEEKKFERLVDDALLGFATSVSVPVFDNE